jgi:hypothetical protein
MFDVKKIKEIENINDMQCTVILDSSKKEFEGEVCSIKDYAAGLRCGIRLLASENEMKTFMKDHFIDPSVFDPAVE